MADPLIAGAFEFRQCQIRGYIGRMQLLGPGFCIPAWLEIGKNPPDLVKADPIRTCIGASAGCKFQPAARNDIRDDFSDIADTVIVFGLPDIECFVVYDMPGGLQYRQESP